MIPCETEIRIFHDQLFRWAEDYLEREQASEFERLRMLGDRFSDRFVAVASSIRESDFSLFREGAVRRCYNPTLLEWLGQKPRSEARRIFSDADGKIPVTESVREGPFPGEAKKAFRKELRKLFPQAERSGGVFTVEEFIGSHRLVTRIDVGHRDGSIDYSHSVYHSSGIQISQIPLSVSSWCGIASMTWWEPHIPEDFTRIRSALLRHISEFRDWLTDFDSHHSPTAQQTGDGNEGHGRP